ncbi:actin-related protein C2B isoform X2 [Tasmannia lanceolata]|uniref:actin-related protein C2B isoform X2 n=1 Tax=Tasmannia lanceolata TaxID=3420 RepID=UPI00406340CF
MACLQRVSPALREILLKLHSVEKPTDIDHHLYEFGSVQYHIRASASDPGRIYLSVSTPPLSPEVLLSNGLANSTSQTVKRVYSDIVEVIEPPREGFLLTLRFDFNKLPQAEEDRIKVITNISSLQAVILSSQLKEMLWDLGSQDTSHEMYRPIKLVYHPREPFFVIRMITAIFPMRFKEDSDVILATAFFQELVDAGCSAAMAKAPICTWSPIPPPELRGEHFNDLSTNGGFVSFDIFSRHVEGAKLDNTVWSLLNFYAYVKYHVKCTRGFIQRRMRKRLESLAEVLQEAKIKGDEDNKKVQDSRSSCVMRLPTFSKCKILTRKCGAFTKKMLTIRSRIKIRGYDRFRRKWLRIPKLTSLRRYTKLD